MNEPLANSASIEKELEKALAELFEAAKGKPGQVLIVGCSTSEVLGKKIGTAGSAETAGALWKAIDRFCRKKKLRAAVQCCEHLNRALVVDRALLEEKGWQEVFAVPRPTAGGALAAAAWKGMKDPALAETIQADMGLDIGTTLIGMHLKRVAVPVRLETRKIGEAPITAARTRPPYTGGPRAVYN